MMPTDHENDARIAREQAEREEAERLAREQSTCPASEQPATVEVGDLFNGE